MKTLTTIVLIAFISKMYSQNIDINSIDTNSIVLAMTKQRTIVYDFDVENQCKYETSPIFIEPKSILYVSGVFSCGYFAEKVIFIKNGKQYFCGKYDVQFPTDSTYEKLSKFNYSELEIFKKNAFKYYTITDSILKSNTLDFLKVAKKNSLFIKDINAINHSEYSKATDLEITIFNYSKKTIKYITFNLTGYNPVGDPIIEKEVKNVKLKGIGPIDSMCYGSYSFEYVWFNNTFDSFNINSITIQYMDGTSKIITNTDAIRSKNQYLNYLPQQQ
jgi:hypothetical protein